MHDIFNSLITRMIVQMFLLNSRLKFNKSWTYQGLLNFSLEPKHSYSFSIYAEVILENFWHSLTLDWMGVMVFQCTVIEQAKRSIVSFVLHQCMYIIHHHQLSLFLSFSFLLMNCSGVGFSMLQLSNTASYGKN